MEPFVRRFIRASLAWLAVGVLVGVAMAFRPYEALALRPAHAHANLLGFVSMMIFGVAYHVIPRFAARPLHNRRLAALHLVVANLGLTLMVGGFVGRLRWADAGDLSLRTGAALGAIGAFLFIYNLWRTLEPAGPAPARSAESSEMVPLRARKPVRIP